MLDLNTQLFRRLMTAALSCPGFTPLMKDDIVYLSKMSEAEAIRQYGLYPSARSWRHQYALAPKPGMPPDVVEVSATSFLLLLGRTNTVTKWYISMIRAQSNRDMMARPVQERNSLQEKAHDTDMHWGYFWAEVGYEYSMGPLFDAMTLAQAANAEFSAIERILTRALPNY